MKYALMFYESPAAFAARTGPDSETYWGAWMAYSKAIEEAGIFKSGECLDPPASATSVRVKGEARKVQDGPFADTKEQLGGIMVVEVPDLNTALEWAARSPSASSGCVEVRPAQGCDVA